MTISIDAAGSIGPAASAFPAPGHPPTAPQDSDLGLGPTPEGINQVALSDAPPRFSELPCKFPVNRRGMSKPHRAKRGSETADDEAGDQAGSGRLSARWALGTRGNDGEISYFSLNCQRFMG